MQLGVQLVNYPHDIVLLKPEQQELTYDALARLDDLFAKYDWQVVGRDAYAKTFTIVAKMSEADSQTFQADLATWRENLSVGLSVDAIYGATMLFDSLIALFCFPADQGTLLSNGLMRVVFNYRQFGYLERRKPRLQSRHDNQKKQGRTS